MKTEKEKTDARGEAMGDGNHSPTAMEEPAGSEPLLFAEPELLALAPTEATFTAKVVGGDAEHPMHYSISLRLDHPWPFVPDWLRTMSTRVKVTFAKVES